MQRYAEPWNHGAEFVNNIIDVIIPPDTILPCQMPSRQRTDTPETALLLAVYRNALWRLENSYMRPHHKALVERGEILSWVYGDGGAASFEIVCATLDVEPEILRAGIVAWCRDMERGKFRKIVVRQSPAKGNSNRVTTARTKYYVRKDDRRRASLEVRP